MSLTVLDRRDAFRKVLDAERASGRRIGLVPTMGSLHAGHISLMERAAGECEVVVATLFVNPLQFGPAEDLETYPRDPEGDRAKAEAAGVAYLFAPSQAEMFPDAAVTVVSVAPLTDVLEGAIRPGHFQGVATIVTKLLSLAGPCRAYFGEKDFQQLAIVRRLTADLSLPAEIVGCPTVRALDGLALSSRNAYLTPEERAVAPTLYRALQAGATAAARETDADAVRSVMSATVADQRALQLQYAEVVDPADLSPLTTLDRDARLLIAARLGRTRLIDNVAATH
ncbi:MAG: pantoate--beta-alanine ligase [Acidimicrobiaceae bacterium]|nr:pantoate--beta-alanine ligase [Acidimicrobiaceae bacterium]